MVWLLPCTVGRLNRRQWLSQQYSENGISFAPPLDMEYAIFRFLSWFTVDSNNMLHLDWKFGLSHNGCIRMAFWSAQRHYTWNERREWYLQRSPFFALFNSPQWQQHVCTCTYQAISVAKPFAVFIACSIRKEIKHCITIDKTVVSLREKKHETITLCQNCT